MSAPSRHSKVIGGSTAARILNCPGSAAIIDQLPKAVNTTSEWAEEGTDLHGYISDLIDAGQQPKIGDQAGGTTITDALLRDVVEPCLDFWRELRPQIDEFAVEVEAPFPGVKDAFGTSDLAARSERLNTTWLTDWKMGAGQSVTATYPDEDDPRFVFINEQLMFYACCLRKLWPEWFPQDVRIVLTIVQPRNQDSAKARTEAIVDNETLDDFETDVRAALAEARQAAARQRIGHWCRFASCKPACRLHNAPLLDITAFERLPVAPQSSEHAVQLTRILELAPVAEALIAEARKQAHELLEAGKSVPGFKLVQKRGQRQWVGSEAETLTALRKTYGLKKAACLETPVLKSPKQIENILPRGQSVPTSLAVMVSSGTTLAPDSDPRPAVERPSQSLKDLLALALAHEVSGD